MTTVTLKFDQEEQAAILSVEQTSLAWTEITRAYIEESDDVFIANETSIQVPWGIFLNSRRLLGHYVNKYSLELDFDNVTDQKLEEARKKENIYEKAVHSNLPKVTKDNLLNKLNEVGFKRELTSFQIRNILKISGLPSAANFSVPGAGKTTEAIAFYYFHREEHDKVLIVCPKNAFAVWEEQFSQCVNESLTITRLTGGCSKAKELVKNNSDVYLISYHFFINIKKLITKLMSAGNFFMILDESHKMKGGYNSKSGQSILELAHLPKHKLVLSGTPLPNSISDLISQFRFLYPEIEPESENIKQYVKPIYVRTKKSELEIPEPERRLIDVPLNTNQRYFYELLTSEILRQSKESLKINEKARLRKLGKSVIRLLQLTSNPSLLIDSDWVNDKLFSAVLEEGDSPKIQYACLQARKLAKENKKVIIWSSFVKNIELISLRLIDLGADFIHGKVEAGSDEEENTREAKIKRFHEDENAYVLVGNPAACGESISLHTVCHHAIYLDRNYNAAHYLQSEDRIHRLGLPPDCKTTIEILNSPWTIDQSVSKRLKEKIGLMSDVLDDEDLNIEPQQFDLEELEIEFSEIGINKKDLDDVLEHLKDYQ